MTIDDDFQKVLLPLIQELIDRNKLISKKNLLYRHPILHYLRSAFDVRF